MINGRLVRRLLLFGLLLQAGRADAREELHQARPLDLLVLRTDKGQSELEVIPLDLPERRIPQPRPTGRIVFQLAEKPGDDVEALWSAITRIEFFEQRLLAEARRLSSEGRFGEAYDYFVRLEKDYPSLQGLEAALETYHKQEALSLFRNGETERALMILQSLNERLPSAKGVAQAVDAVANKTLSDQWENRDYDGLRATLGMLRTQFRELSLGVEDKWKDRLVEAAEELRQLALEQASAGRHRLALQTIEEAESLDQGSPRNVRLREQIRRDNPALWVGVFDSPTDPSEPGLDRPATQRVGWLFGRELVRLEDYGPTGGEYGSPVGEIQSDDSRRSVRLEIESDSVSAHRVARDLLWLSTTNKAPLLSAYAESLEIPDEQSLVVSLARQHPRPQALLKGATPPRLAESLPSRWAPAEASAGRRRYRRTGDGGGAFSIIEETIFQEADQAVTALLAGEIDLLADAPPWWIDRLRKASGVRLGRLRIPTLHCLVFGPDTPLRKDRETRRALLYGIARETILQELLTAGEPLQGYETLTGPLPKGLSLGDPIRYGYNDALPLRPYEPRLAALLLTASRRSREAPTDDDVDLKKLNLVLAHTPTPVASVACSAIARQLRQIGLSITFVEASEQQFARREVEYDLRYARLSVGEPMIDAWRLYGPEGLTGDSTAAMRLALDDLLNAASGQDIADALRQIHEIGYSDASVLPLWQTIDHFAYRSDLVGLPETTIGLYKTVDDWRLSDSGGAR